MTWEFPEATPSIPEWELPESTHSTPSDHPDGAEPSSHDDTDAVAEESGECYTEVEELTCQEGDASVYLSTVGGADPVSV